MAENDSALTYPHCRQITVGRSDFFHTDFDGIVPGMLSNAVSSGLDVNVESDSGGSYTMLQLSIELGRVDLVERLVQLGATVVWGMRGWDLRMSWKANADDQSARLVRIGTPKALVAPIASRASLYSSEAQ